VEAWGTFANYWSVFFILFKRSKTLCRRDPNEDAGVQNTRRHLSCTHTHLIVGVFLAQRNTHRVLEEDEDHLHHIQGATLLQHYFFKPSSLWWEYMTINASAQSLIGVECCISKSQVIIVTKGTFKRFGLIFLGLEIKKCCILFVVCPEFRFAFVSNGEKAWIANFDTLLHIDLPLAANASTKWSRI